MGAKKQVTVQHFWYYTFFQIAMQGLVFVSDMDNEIN